MKSSIVKSLAWVSVLFAVACGGPAGPHVHVASATRADLEAVKDADVVWYEFRPGDEVPFQFLFIGVALAGSEPIKFLAKEHFYIVMKKGMPLMFSFDGKTISGAERTQLLVAVVPGDDGRARLVWLNYVGNGGSADAELERLMSQGSSGPEGESAPAGAQPTEGQAEPIAASAAE